jgi:hypothetical protein
LFGGVVLGDSANSELCGFSIGHGPRIAIPGEHFGGLGAFDRWGELLVPHGLGLSSPFGISSLDSGIFAEESGKIFCGSCTIGKVKKTQHNGRFKLSLPVDLDSECPVPHFFSGFLLLRRSIGSLALASSGPRRPDIVICQ